MTDKILLGDKNNSFGSQVIELKVSRKYLCMHVFINFKYFFLIFKTVIKYSITIHVSNVNI